MPFEIYKSFNEWLTVVVVFFGYSMLSHTEPLENRPVAGELRTNQVDIELIGVSQHNWGESWGYFYSRGL